MILSVAMMLSWLGANRGSEVLASAGSAIEQAVDDVLKNPETRTMDLGGTMATDAFGAEVAKAAVKRLK
jgi:3-isopropylmalate dehydrogenase